MDVRLSDGDILMLSSGDYEYITDIEEAVQRVRISALTMKGDFIYDRGLGTDYSGLSADDPLLIEKLDMRIKESCADIHDTAVSVIFVDPAIMTAVIKINYQNKETTTEVDLSGIIQ